MISLQAPNAFGDDHDEDGDEAINCVGTRSIRTTDILDDSTIVFELTGKRLYVNHLPRKCPSLYREGKFSYTSNTSRLCSSDFVRVLQDMGGGLTEGPHCSLGKFYPTTAEELDAITARQNAPVMPKEVDGAEPEEVGEDETEDDQQD